MSNRVLYLAIAFVFGFLLTGIPYWLVPSDVVALPDSLSVVGLGAISIIAFMLVATRTSSARLASVVMLSAPAFAVFARVVAETARDPTSHNLWPFEIAYTLFAAGIFVLPAVVAAAVVRWRLV